jgi:DNA repair ATPase RecN
MDKQKQIEEMVKTMGNWAQRNNMCWNDGHAKSLAEALSEEYQPKIHENVVVLTREEYEKLKQYEEKVKSGACFTQKEWLELCDEECKRNAENLSKARRLERKETAEKFADRLKLKLKELELGGWVEVATGSMCMIIDGICKEITEGGNVQNKCNSSQEEGV